MAALHCGGFRGGAQGPHQPHVFWLKRNKCQKGEKSAGQVNQNQPPVSSRSGSTTGCSSKHLNYTPEETKQRYSLFTNKAFDIQILPTTGQKESFVSTANKPLVGTLMTTGDGTVSIAIRSMPYLTPQRVYIQIGMTAFLYYFFDCNPEKT